MSAIRTMSVRSRLLWSLLLLMPLVFSGCKKKSVDKPPKEAAAQQDKSEAEKAAQPAPAAEEPEAAPVVDVIESEAPEAAAPEATPPAAAERPIERREAPPGSSSVYATDLDKERMARLFGEMWCAELRGASKDELLELYHKYDYPPLDRWYDDWNAVIVDRSWVRETVAKARSRCPEAARNASNKLPGMVPPKPGTDPAPAGVEQPAAEEKPAAETQPAAEEKPAAATQPVADEKPAAAN